MTKPDQHLILILGDQLSLSLSSLRQGDKFRDVVLMWSGKPAKKPTPTTIGMSLHADGGLLGSKPYASSGNYINKMSDYCKSCHYDVKQRTGPEACPFNALYWDFIARHHARFSKNARMANITRVYGKFDEAEKLRIKESAEGFLGGVESWV